MLFDHDAKVSGDRARFADLPGGRLAGAACMPMREHAENPAGMGTTLTATLFSGGRTALAHWRVPRVPAPRWSTAPDSNLVAAGLLADARTACGRQARTVRPMWLADRRPVPAVCRRTGPLMDDRTHFFVLTLRAISADALASWASYPGRADVSRLTPYPLRKGRCKGKAAPDARRDAGPHISGDMPGGRSASVFLPDAPRLTVVPWRELYLPPFPGATRA